MGNAEMKPGAFGLVLGVTPPVAPPAQPGEDRSCLNCIRCVEIFYRMTTAEKMVADCLWHGEWCWPTSGCDRWALHPEPLQELLPWVKPPAPLVYRGPRRPKRRFR
jgi:hypothetical protein